MVSLSTMKSAVSTGTVLRPLGKVGLLLALAGAFVLARPSSAYASFQLMLSDGVHSAITVTDCTSSPCSGGDTNPATGLMQTTSSIGNFTLVITTDQSKPTLGTAGAPQLDITYTVDFNNNGASCTGASAGCTLTIDLSDTGFTGIGTAVAGNGGTLAAGASGTFAAYYDNGNTDFATTHQIGSTLSFFSPANTQGSVSGATPYSLTEVLTFTFPSSSSTLATTGDANLTVSTAPEPASLTLLGAGLVGLATRARRRLFRKG